MFQLDLPFSRNIDTLKDYFEKATGKAVALTLTDNSTSMLSVKTKGTAVSVRLHQMFLYAGNDVIKEVTEFIKNKKGSTPFIRKFIRENQHCLNNKPHRTISLCTQGRYYDLRELFDSLNNEYFKGMITAKISWGKKNPRWAVRKRTLGSYSSHTNTIRINPVLDRKNVPQYVIKFIIYHEMLHSDMHMEKNNGRRFIHTPGFKKRERLFEYYEKAISWEKRN